MSFRILVRRPWAPKTFDFGDVILSTDFSEHEVDALLCEWAPHPDILTFDGPAAWYTCEPRSHPQMGVQATPGARPYLESLPA